MSRLLVVVAGAALALSAGAAIAQDYDNGGPPAADGVAQPQRRAALERALVQFGLSRRLSE